MRTIKITLTFVIFMFLAALALGQEAKVAQSETKRPELAREAAQTLDLAIVKIENWDLKIKLMEQERDTLKLAAQQFIESLKVDGYNLVRTEQGKWEYVKATK